MRSFSIAALIAVGFVGVPLTLALAQSNTMRPEQMAIGSGTKTATATAGAATLNKSAGVVTSEALTTAAAANYTLTITDSAIAATDQVFASVSTGTATTGEPSVLSVKPGAGSVVIVVRNEAASAALNGTVKVAFMVLKN